MPRPCPKPGCPEVVPTGSYCVEHKAEKDRRARAEGGSPGTTAAWRKARKAALRRDRHRCTECGRTQAEARCRRHAARRHHLDGMSGGVGAKTHDISLLRTLCRTPCHTDTFRQQASERRKPRPGGDTHKPPWMLD
jgi:5-methylcytosine-specific restriction endonuclease McrA